MKIIHIMKSLFGLWIRLVLGQKLLIPFLTRQRVGSRFLGNFGVLGELFRWNSAIIVISYYFTFCIKSFIFSVIFNVNGIGIIIIINNIAVININDVLRFFYVVIGCFLLRFLVVGVFGICWKKIASKML